MSEVVAWTRGLTSPARAARVATGAGGGRSAPLVAILCTAPRAKAAAAGVALAAARAFGSPYALAAVLGDQPAGPLAGVPSAHRAAAALRERALPATVSGRVVWLADRRGPLAADAAGRAAALSAELGRSAAALGAPAAVAIPVARIAGLDRVLAWHDALVVVREPDAADGVVERALASLAEIGRPAVAMTPPRVVSGALAVAGLAVPPEAKAALAELALAAGRGDG